MGDDTTVAQSVMIAGLIFTFLGPLFVLTRLRTPRLTTAPDGRLLISGAGRTSKRGRVVSGGCQGTSSPVSW